MFVLVTHANLKGGGPNEVVESRVQTDVLGGGDGEAYDSENNKVLVTRTEMIITETKNQSSRKQQSTNGDNATTK